LKVPGSIRSAVVGTNTASLHFGPVMSFVCEA
jgi:hypothetical protein